MTKQDRFHALRGSRLASELDDAQCGKLAELIEEDEGTLLRIRVGSLDWAASVLAGLGCGFTIRRPEELRASIRALAERLALSA